MRRAKEISSRPSGPMALVYRAPFFPLARAGGASERRVEKDLLASRNSQRWPTKIPPNFLPIGAFCCAALRKQPNEFPD